MTLRSSLPMVALAGTLAALGVGLAATRAQRATAPAAPASAPPGEYVLGAGARGVATAPVRAEPIADHLDVPGTIEADPSRVVRVYPPVSGRLVAVPVRPADAVERGTVVAVLASSDVAAAEAAFGQAEADALVKRRAVERERTLYENKVVALRDYEQAQADAAMAAAALRSAAERLELLGVDTASTTDQVSVRAPSAGLVTDVGAAPGEYAKSLDNSNPLCTIADLSTVWAVGGVYEKDLASVHAGDPVDVTTTAYPGRAWHGRIGAVAGVLDTATHTVQVRVVLENPGLRLKPQMFASIRVARATRLAVVVPAPAVVREGDSSYVLVEGAPGHFTRRWVTLGTYADPGRVEVAAGLQPGDVIVVQGAELLTAVATAS